MATVCSSHQRIERKGVRLRKGGFMGGSPEELKEKKEEVIVFRVSYFPGGRQIF